MDPRAYVIHVRNGETRSFEGHTQTFVMVEFVEYLIKEHRLLEKISLPYSPGEMTRAILNSEPKYADGVKEMVRYRKVGDVYLDTLTNSEGKQRQIWSMASECGLSVQFEGRW